VVVAAYRYAKRARLQVKNVQEERIPEAKPWEEKRGHPCLSSIAPFLPASFEVGRAAAESSQWLPPTCVNNKHECAFTP
jgi:hypothetical protein